jgi:hypothetical protein
MNMNYFIRLAISRDFYHIAFNNSEEARKEMKMKNYLSSLIRKHRKLDAQIEKARHDIMQVRRLKKLRLQLKDRIQLIRRASYPTGPRQST